jgi:hypothetical protein
MELWPRSRASRQHSAAGSGSGRAAGSGGKQQAASGERARGRGLVRACGRVRAQCVVVKSRAVAGASRGEQRRRGGKECAAASRSCASRTCASTGCASSAPAGGGGAAKALPESGALVRERRESAARQVSETVERRDRARGSRGPAYCSAAVGAGALRGLAGGGAAASPRSGSKLSRGRARPAVRGSVSVCDSVRLVVRQGARGCLRTPS